MMKARLKKKLAKRRGYKRYDNTGIKIQNFVEAFYEEHAEVYQQLYLDQIIWGCAQALVTNDGKVVRINPYVVCEEEGKVIFSNGSEVKILHR